MARTIAIAAALVGVSLVLAPAAAAHGKSDFYVDGPAFLPGQSVTVHGVFLDSNLAVPAEPVAVTLGVDGPVMGQTQASADGSWSLTFTLPTATVQGTYALLASAGEILARAALVVGAPPAVVPQGQQSQPQAQQIQPVAEKTATGGWKQLQTQTHTKPTVTSVGLARPDVVPLSQEQAVRIRRTHTRPERVAARPRAQISEPALQRAEPRNVRIPASPMTVSSGRQYQPWILAAVLFLLFASSVSCFVYRWRKRPESLAAPDAIELELQEIIAEELAERAARGSLVRQ